MVRAIIFDCFGVLVTEGWLSFKQRYFGKDAALEQEATDLRRQVDAGLMSYGEFAERIATLAGVTQGAFRAAIEQNAPNEELFDYIEGRFKPRYKIGLLSNAASNRLESLFGARRAEMFDEVALSFETGAIKPDARAYAEIAAKLGVEPAECIFVDDQERHISGARDAGMQAVLYEDFGQFKGEIELILTTESGDSEN